ncbi:SBBP repeat-containing protein [Bacteroidota bacterium]
MKTIKISAIIIGVVFLLSQSKSIAANNYDSFVNNMNSPGFIENKGQIIHQDGKQAEKILYMYTGNGMNIQIERNSFSYELYRNIIDEKKNKKENIQGLPGFDDFEDYKVKYHRVDINLINSNSMAEVIAEGKSREYYNYYNEATPLEGILNVHKYKNITVKDVYPGIDLIFYFDDKSSPAMIKYDFIIKPGASIDDIQLNYTGADRLNISDDGKLEIHTSLGMIKENIPLAYYKDNLGKIFRTEIKYKLSGDKLSFNSSEQKEDKILVIDPELFWGTYYAGKGYDEINDIAVDSKDFIYAVGNTQSVAKIATAGAHQTTYTGTTDAMLAKFNNQGRLEWATYYGGDQTDYGMMAITTKEDSIIIAGFTTSQNAIATPGAYQPAYGGGVTDGFIAKFNTAGQRLWGSYYGGSEYDVIYAISQDSSYNIVICGKTQSLSGIATANSYQDYKEGLVDGFIVKFDSSMNRKWGTYFGGPESGGTDVVSSVAADRAGNIFFTGYTPCTYSISNDLGWQENYGGGTYDAFIGKLYPSGSAHWISYYGGSNDDIGRSVATYGNGKVYLIGNTKSYNNISSNGAYQETLAGEVDVFIAKFDLYGERLWGTYFGGPDEDWPVKISKVGFDETIALGHTNSTSGIATPGEIQTSNNGNSDNFIVRFSGSGERKWATYFGGAESEYSLYGGLSFDKKGNMFVAGLTNSSDEISTPWTNPHQAFFEGDTIWGEDPPGSGNWVIGGYLNDGFIIMIGTRITINNNFNALYCLGVPIEVPFTVGLDFNPDNIFTLQLSDTIGDFSNPIDIGTLSSNSSGYIDGVIPNDITPGNGYRIRIAASSPSNISEDNGFDIRVAPLPEPEISGETSVCSRNTYNYIVLSQSGYNNQWFVTDGQIIGDSTASGVRVNWGDSYEGTLKVIQTISGTGCIDSTELDVEIIISPQPIITGKTSVTAYSTESYSTPSQSILDYEWVITGGEIQGIDDDNRIEVLWSGPGIGSIRLKITDTRNSCSDTLVITVSINSSPLEILGKKTVCAFSEEIYSVLTESTRKNLWSVTGGEISGSNEDSTVVISWGDAGEGFVELVQTDTVSQEMDTVVQRIEIIALPVVGVLGVDEVCEGLPEQYNAVNTENRTNKWTVYNGEMEGVNTADSIIVSWNNIDKDEDSLFIKASVSLEQTDLQTGCINTLIKIINISKNPSAEFTGSTSVCTGRVETYIVNEKTALINEWLVTGGTIIGSSEDSTIQIEWGEAGVGQIELIQTGATLCIDSSITDIIINVVPVKPTISQSGKVLISSAEEGNQWFFNGDEIPDATNQFLMPEQTGYYTVQVTNSKYCKSDMSQPYNFALSVSDGSLIDHGISVYPNPTGDILHIDFGESNYGVSNIRLLNAIGKVIYYTEQTIGESILKIDLNSFSSGFYILEVQIGNKIYHEKIVKH